MTVLTTRRFVVERREKEIRPASYNKRCVFPDGTTRPWDFSEIVDRIE
jgi:hypothetical protein